MAHGQCQPACVDSGHGGQHLAAMQGQRFFAKNVFAGLGGLNHLCAVLGVRRAQNHALNARVGQGGSQVRQKINAQILREAAAGLRVQVTAGHQGQHIGVFDQLRDGLAPPAQADDGDSEFFVVGHANKVKTRLMNPDCNLSAYQHKGKRGDPKVRLKTLQLHNFKMMGSTASPCASTRPMTAVCA